MPRKRNTKLTQRRKPKQPDEESSHSLAEEEEKARLESFLNDFDIEVEKRVLSMRAQMKSMCTTIHQAFNLEILKLPNHLRNTRRSQVFGEKEAKVIAAEVDQQIDCLIESTLKTAPAAQEGTQTKKGKRRKKGTTAKKSATTARKKRTTTDENEPPATSARATRTSTRPTRASSRNRNLMETPANTIPPCGYDTPFFTPKFDPRLPVTTGRKPKRGEVTMSFAGSPVVNENGNSKGASPKETPLLARLQKIHQEVSETSEIEDENVRKQVFSQLNGMLNSLLKNVKEESEIE